MIESLRKKFNEQFTQNQYEQVIQLLEKPFSQHIGFKVSETPVFIESDFLNKSMDLCHYIIDEISQDSFKVKTEQAIPLEYIVPNEKKNIDFLVIDMAIAKDVRGQIVPSIIEIQAFPTIVSYQIVLERYIKEVFSSVIPSNFTGYCKGFDAISAQAYIKKILLGNISPENTILLDVKPNQQKTNIDFYYTEQLFGISAVCLSELIAEGRQLFYKKNGKKILIRRIYNRLIFDELDRCEPIFKEKLKILFQPLDVEWVSHPNWFYRVSKYAIPFLHHPYIPETRFLSAVKELPKDLENYVLKPLFSFAGIGVMIDITKESIATIKDPQYWILQRKVVYAPIIRTLDEPAKVEIRFICGCAEEDKKPKPILNLVRLSKGKMIGVDFNKNKTWVGGSVAFWEK